MGETREHPGIEKRPLGLWIAAHSIAVIAATHAAVPVLRRGLETDATTTDYLMAGVAGLVPTAIGVLPWLAAAWAAKSVGKIIAQTSTERPGTPTSAEAAATTALREAQTGEQRTRLRLAAWLTASGMYATTWAAAAWASPEPGGPGPHPFIANALPASIAVALGLTALDYIKTVLNETLDAIRSETPAEPPAAAREDPEAVTEAGEPETAERPLQIRTELTAPVLKAAMTNGPSKDQGPARVALQQSMGGSRVRTLPRDGDELQITTESQGGRIDNAYAKTIVIGAELLASAAPASRLWSGDPITIKRHTDSCWITSRAAGHGLPATVTVPGTNDVTAVDDGEVFKAPTERGVWETPLREIRRMAETAAGLQAGSQESGVWIDEGKPDQGHTGDASCRIYNVHGRVVFGLGEQTHRRNRDASGCIRIPARALSEFVEATARFSSHAIVDIHRDRLVMELLPLDRGTVGGDTDHPFDECCRLQTRWKADRMPRDDAAPAIDHNPIRTERRDEPTAGDADGNPAAGTPARQLAALIKQVVNTQRAHHGPLDDSEEHSDRVTIQPNRRPIESVDDRRVAAKCHQLDIGEKDSRNANVHGPTAEAVLETIANGDNSRMVEVSLPPEGDAVEIRELGGTGAAAWLHQY